MDDRNLTSEEEIRELPERVEVVDIQFRPGQKIYFFDPAGMELTPGQHVIIETARGSEYGTCTGGNHMVAGKDVVAPLRRCIRVATSNYLRLDAVFRNLYLVE